MSDRHTFSHRAMACDWGITLYCDDARYAAQAARAAWDEVDRLERELSRFVRESDISRINLQPASVPLRIGPDAFACIEMAHEIAVLTGGAFDLTIGSRVNTRSRDDERSGDGHAIISDSDAPIDMRLLPIDRASRSVARLDERIRVDLGAIGKGYAVDQAVTMLREWRIEAALVHSGGSTAYALGAPPATDAWPLDIRNPLRHDRILCTEAIRDAALSGSGTLLHGEHIIDPRSGRSATGPLAAWVLAASAAESDAISTALMVMDEPAIVDLSRRRPDMTAWYVPRALCGAKHQLIRVRAGESKPAAEFDTVAR
ncbi:MAG: FAD:protein FMN transferase [Phycisphaerae bacterium]